MAETVFKFNFGSGERTCETNLDCSSLPHATAVAENRPDAVHQANSDLVDRITPILVNSSRFEAADLLRDGITVLEHWNSARDKNTSAPVDNCRLAQLYEGGFERWECAEDLISYLKNEKAQQRGLFRGSDIVRLRVLELGCGRGRPGKFLLQCKFEHADAHLSSKSIAEHSNGSCVDFQDYNHEVLQTLKSELLNIRRKNLPNDEPPASLDEHTTQQVSFYAGDWRVLLSVLPHRSYDCILTAETCYDATQIPALHAVLDHCLRNVSDNPDAVAYVAGKCEYAGKNCGGGTTAFEEYVIRNKTFEVCDRQGYADSNSSNILMTGLRREVLALRRLGR